MYTNKDSNLISYLSPNKEMIWDVCILWVCALIWIFIAWCVIWLILMVLSYYHWQMGNTWLCTAVFYWCWTICVSTLYWYRFWDTCVAKHWIFLYTSYSSQICHLPVFYVNLNNFLRTSNSEIRVICIGFRVTCFIYSVISLSFVSKS